MNTTTFDSLGLSHELTLALADMAFVTPSPIQAEAIPHLFENKDIVGQAQTGTGKTAAFAIPIIERLDPESRKVQAVVLCPTRELAIQVAEEFRKLTKYKKNIAVVSIYGGQPIDRQFIALKKRPQIIIGTPGRMLDHLRRGSLRMDAVKTIVLDEADEMLDMGFRDDIETILNQTPEIRQTILFSATMPRAILELTRKYQRNPIEVKVLPQKMEAALIEQQYFEIPQRSKHSVLTHLIEQHDLKLALVFCNTKRQVDELVDNLQAEGYQAGGLHGGMVQNKRDSVMGRFRKGTIQILVATDVAARGIDVNDIQAVVNYDVPQDTENYIHRIGRTGRAGKTGLAFTFVAAGQFRQLQMIQRTLETKLQRHVIPGMPELTPKPFAAARPRTGKPRRAGAPGGNKPDTMRKVYP